MKFKDLVNTRKDKQNSKFKIIINELQLKRIIDRLFEEQIENKINEHKAIKTK